METNPDVILTLRRARGMTQGQLAMSAGISKQVLSKIELGKTRRPRAHTLAAIANALGVSIADLIVGEYDEDPDGRRRTVAHLYRLGLSVAVIAKHLGLSRSTVQEDIRALIGTGPR